MRIEPMELRDGDVLVVSTPEPLTKEHATAIQEIVEAKFPGHTAVVLSGGFALQVLRPAA